MDKPADEPTDPPLGHPLGQPMGEPTGQPTEEPTGDIAERLREAVRAAGGNRAVAERSGVPVATVNRYVRSNGGMKVDALQSLATTCNVSLQWLVTGQPPTNGAQPIPPATTPPGFRAIQADLSPPAAPTNIDIPTLAKAIEIVATIGNDAGAAQPNAKEMAERIAAIYAVLARPPESRD